MNFRVRRGGEGGSRVGGGRGSNNYRSSNNKSKKKGKDGKNNKHKNSKTKGGNNNSNKNKMTATDRNEQQQQQQQQEVDPTPTYDVECQIHVLLRGLPASQAPVCHLTTCTYHDPAQVAEEKDKRVWKREVTFAKDANKEESGPLYIATVANLGDDYLRSAATEKKERKFRKKDIYNFPLGNLSQESKENLKQELLEMKARGLPVGFHNRIAYDVDSQGELDVRSKFSFRCARARKKVTVRDKSKSPFDEPTQ